MENVKVESRYLKLCYEFRAFIRCIKAVFYRPDHQKLLMYPLIKRLGRAFVSKNAAELLKRSSSFETLGRVFEGLRENWKLRRGFEKLSRVFEKLGYVFVL